MTEDCNMRKLDLIINKILHLFELRKIKTKEKTIFLTFDDGPEPGITEFVLDELRKYNAKATFFCRGDNAEKYPNLLESIKVDGHSLGNHTYSHLNSFQTSTNDYISNVEKANIIIKSELFRPPWGCISLPTYLKLIKKYRIIYWSLSSGDTDLDKFNEVKSLNNLKFKTSKGKIILFHFCTRHEKETRKLLPKYLDWLYEQGYKCETI